MYYHSKNRIWIAIAAIIMVFSFFATEKGEAVNFTPTDDSFIADDNPDGVNGAYSDALVGYYMGVPEPPPYPIRRMYLQFDISSLPYGMEITDAVLKVYCLWTDTVVVQACHLDDDNWDEVDLCWRNAPTNLKSTHTKTAYPMIWTIWNVIPDVVDAYEDDQVISFVLKIPNDGNSYGWAEYATKEYGDPNFHPVLQIYYEPPPSPDTVGVWSELDGVWKSDAQWGDLNNDGYVDLVISGEMDDASLITRTYFNFDGNYMQATQDLVGVKNESAGNLSLGDYNGDGLLDLAMAGVKSDGTRITRLYKNDGTGVLVWDSLQAFIGVSNAAVAWGDYDNDGDLDLVVTGHDGTQGLSTLYENDPLGTLSFSQALTGLYCGSADWGDIDSDGDFDLLLTGHDGTNQQADIYENNPTGTLTNVGSRGLPGVCYSDAAFGDCENDGDLDIALTGNPGTTPHIGRVYENDGLGNFTPAGDNLLAVYRSSCAWGDLDNDGDLDVAFSGYDGSGLYTRIFRNSYYLGFGSFYLAHNSPPLHWLREGSLSWADVDNDSDLDFLVTGADWYSAYTTIYERTGALNTAPSAPTGLYCEKTSTGLRPIWAGASDPETSTSGLYYNLRIGTASNGHDVMSGVYGSPLMGNVDQNTEMLIDETSSTFYYCAVQAIDAGLAASDWTAEVKSHVCGDANGDGATNIGDAVFLINFIFSAGPAPDPMCMADANGDGQVNIGDAVYLINFVFNSGPAPVEGCCGFDKSSGASLKVAPSVLRAVYNGEKTIIEIESATDIYGLQMEINCTPGAEITQLVENTQLYGNCANSRTTVGILDINGYGHINAGHATVLEIDGYVMPISALAADGMGNTMEMMIETAEKTIAAPDIFALEQNCPNPFNPTTEIRFTLPTASNVTLDVFNINGQKVTTLVGEKLEAGEHAVIWNGTTSSGESVSSGIYLYRINADKFTATRKMVLLK
jgi:hypothetical protein